MQAKSCMEHTYRDISVCGMADNHGACLGLTSAHSFMDAAHTAVKHSDGASLHLCNVDLMIRIYFSMLWPVIILILHIV